MANNMNKNHVIIRLLLIGIAIAGLAGCGTLFSDGEDVIHFESDPVGAQLYINGQLKGNTPLDVTLERDVFEMITVKLKKPGYQTHEFELQKALNRTSFFNLTSIFSWGTDIATGHAMRYSPNSYLIELKYNGKKTSSISPPNLHRTELNRFVLSNYDELLDDIAKGEGEYLVALAAMVGVGESHLSVFSATLKVELPALSNTPSPLLSIPLIEKAAAATRA